MQLPDFATRRPVTVIMVFTAMLVLGTIAAKDVGMEMFPKITMPTASVFVIYPGVSPYEVESAVSKRVEDAVSSLNGVEAVETTIQQGFSVTAVRFNWDVDLDLVVGDIREQISRIIEDFPDEVQTPFIMKYDPSNLPTLILSVTAANRGTDLRQLFETRIADRFERIDGVARLEIEGGRLHAVLIHLDVEKLAARNIPITQLLRLFPMENMNLPGGELTAGGQNLIVRTIGEFNSLDDIRNMIIGYNGMAPVYLKDIATVSEGKQDSDTVVHVNEQNGLQVFLYKQPDRNTVKVADRVLDEITAINDKYRGTLDISIQKNEADSVRISLGGVKDAGLQGGLLAILVLLFFLRNLRSTLIVSLAIPVSVVATFSVIYFAGLTLNIITLMGIALGVGMVVDNSIVVIESIFRKVSEIPDRRKAVVTGTMEVGMAITASTLTTIGVFLPIVFVKGISGVIFRELGLTLSAALLISLGSSLALIPVLSVMLLRSALDAPKNDATARRGAIGRLKSFGNAVSVRRRRTADVLDGIIHYRRIIRVMDSASVNMLIWLDEHYTRLLKRALNRRWQVIAGAVVLFILSIAMVRLLGFEFLPAMDEGTFVLDLETRMGAPIKETEALTYQVEKILIRSVPEMESYSATIGRSGGLMNTKGTQLAGLNVRLVPAQKRSRSIETIINSLTRRIRSEVPGVRVKTKITGLSNLLSIATGGKKKIAIEIAGENLEASLTYAKKILSQVKAVPGTREQEISFHKGRPELQFRINRERAAAYGLPPRQIAAVIRTALKGVKVSTYRVKGQDLDIVLQFDKKSRDNLDAIRMITFANQTGSFIPLENVVDIIQTTGPTYINRYNRTRVIYVEADLDEGVALNKTIQTIKDRMAKTIPIIPPGINIRFTGEGEEMDKAFGDLFFALILAIFIVYAIMASQFENLLHPLIIMFSVPCAVIGVVLFLMLTGTVFSIVAFIGAILLVGIVVNNAIVLIDYVNHLRREEGYHLRDALIQGARTRLRPILMTTLTTVLGMLPMSLGFGAGSELRAPMARAIVGGLSTSTLITLVLIPVIYFIVERFFDPEETE